MLVTDENMRRESLAWFRRQADHGVQDAARLAEHLRGTAAELEVDGYLPDAKETVKLLSDAAELAEQVRRMVSLAESKLPPVVR